MMLQPVLNLLGELGKASQPSKFSLNSQKNSQKYIADPLWFFWFYHK